MEVLYILVPLSVVLALVIGLVFVLAIRSGQFEDLEGPAYRMLADKDEVDPPKLSASTSRDQSLEP